MKSSIMVAVVLAFIGAVVVLNIGVSTTPVNADTKTPEELSMHMDHLRRQAHKLGLAIDAKNQPLAAYYMSEIEQQVVRIQNKFPTYDGIQVAALAKAMLDPYTAPLNKAVGAGDWAAAGPAYEKLITAGCNGCHTATQRQFIKVTVDKKNGYNQSFTP